MATTKSLKELTKPLQSYFSSAQVPAALPDETRQTLQHFVQGHEGGVSPEDSSKVNTELRHLHEHYVGNDADRRGIFMGVLRELRPVLCSEQELLDWYKLLARPIICNAASNKLALDDVHDFVLQCMFQSDELYGQEDSPEHHRLSNRLRNELLNIYISQTGTLAEGEEDGLVDKLAIARTAERILLSFGRKQPKDFFHSIDDLVLRAETRLQALSLLTSFLRLETPHLYLVINTPLIEHLLKCLMNDLSTAVLSAALTCLVMLMPHIPGSLAQHLPRLFLIYSRLLCWEKFSPLSTEAQRNLVTDDRVATGPDAEEDHGDVGIDASWEKVRPEADNVEARTPELLTYFTYLYGLYPLNFMSYIRKPRKYLRAVEFPGAEDFDLDQTVIRSRTDQFRQVHTLHPNFYNMTIDEELSDPKWPKVDPADVVAECHGLYINNTVAITSPAPPPSSRLPPLPISPSIPQDAASTTSWRDSSTFVADSPTLRPQSDRPRQSEFPSRPVSKGAASSTYEAPHKEIELSPKNIAYLQRQNTMLWNELNFEKWHKQQYLVHIGQLTRKNVRDATAEAETLNLINANRALKKQLEQLRTAREATIKDSALTRKRADNLEANMQERFMKMRKEEDKWMADGDELNRLRSETKQYRELLATSEDREKHLENQNLVMARELTEQQKIVAQLREVTRRLREYEYREFEFDRSDKEKSILESENRALRAEFQRFDQDRIKTRRLYMERVTALETQLQQTRDALLHSEVDVNSPSQDTTELQAKFDALKKSHHRLIDKHTDLEIEYQSLKTELDDVRAEKKIRSSLKSPDRHVDFDDLGGLMVNGLSDGSRSLPSTHGHANPDQSKVGGLNVRPETPDTFSSPNPNRRFSIPSTKYNETAPLSQSESYTPSERGSVQSNGEKKKKIDPQSEVRVFGRGGRQNIKLTEKTAKGPAEGKISAFRRFL